MGCEFDSSLAFSKLIRYGVHTGKSQRRTNTFTQSCECCMITKLYFHSVYVYAGYKIIPAKRVKRLKAPEIDQSNSCGSLPL